jgi:hypothetical protein
MALFITSCASLAGISGCATITSPADASHAVTISSEPEGLPVYGLAQLLPSGYRVTRKLCVTPGTIPVQSGSDPAATLRLMIETKDRKIPFNARLDHCYHIILNGPDPRVLEDGNRLESILPGPDKKPGAAVSPPRK